MRRLAVPLLALCLLPAQACVTRGTYLETAEARDALELENARLARDLKLARASNESLSSERSKLVDEIETLRIARASLSDSVARLEEERDQLAGDLERRRREVEESRQEVDALRSTYDGLVDDLQREVAQGRVQIERLREGLRVHLSQEVLFPVGSAELDASGREILARVAGRLAELPHTVSVHGHTDDQPIHGALARVYPTNWELAGARAASVVRLLEERGISGDRLEAVSFGASQPRASNDTPEGRAYNRRIELQLTPAPDAAVPMELAAPSAAEAPAAPVPDEDPWAHTVGPPAAGADAPADSNAGAGSGAAAADPLVPPAGGEVPPESLGPPVRGEVPPESLGPPVRGEKPPAHLLPGPGATSSDP